MKVSLVALIAFFGGVSAAGQASSAESLASNKDERKLNEYYPVHSPTHYYPEHSPTHYYHDYYRTPYPTHARPTPYPTGRAPTPRPTPNPTPRPTPLPTKHPTYHPTPYPTYHPTPYPTYHPTPYPIPYPVKHPDPYPKDPYQHNPYPYNPYPYNPYPYDPYGENPHPIHPFPPPPDGGPQRTSRPTPRPTPNPTPRPTPLPTLRPITKTPPTGAPTFTRPSESPSTHPTGTPSTRPSAFPSSGYPSENPTNSEEPSENPTQSEEPSENPTQSEEPSENPTTTQAPSDSPSVSQEPSQRPSQEPSTPSGPTLFSVICDQNNTGVLGAFCLVVSRFPDVIKFLGGPSDTSIVTLSQDDFTKQVFDFVNNTSTDGNRNLQDSSSISSVTGFARNRDSDMQSMTFAIPGIPGLPGGGATLPGFGGVRMPKKERTVFPFTNIAFRQFVASNITLFNDLFNEKGAETLENLVWYHMINDEKRFQDLTCNEPVEMVKEGTTRTECRNGFKFQVGEKNPKASQPKIVLTTNSASNGALHLVDKVILPNSLPISTVQPSSAPNSAPSNAPSS
eukprot:CAMPEP_0172376806 /NCGR_PEP_ID=MMETSP1060-20121228/68575_1 /TAXON_ID=37318 /ORGANISM="Pseudo-nitzschia pungens, Strain cf. cingulata" /LENGTH=563 /DNA_ID=CAMNT_0013104469 /DNA_START=95 /DNA_END=1789 /DNA_ORIENTATION=-